jgi:signal transduction histidine kinase
VLSHVGQAANFTISFDDLLELIYTQTSKLIPVPNFYIALYEQKIERMYFAFFVEDDERYENRENQRWSMDNSLLSQIVRENKRVRVASYKQESDRRGITHHHTTDKMNAWISVPLEAGNRRIGVMAAGKTREMSEYTDEQFKIFINIGTLAATLIDKANLFDQAKIRERQLTVLNEISRQLVATESDVERLLQIIMQSSVDILNAEAGSLLLGAEDGTGDIEFRVVIGGGGADLIGTRLNKGYGIVGRVMDSGQPEIVNDAISDPRHTQEVTENFTSRSLLAVPLTAKNKVIGVLEVINKKDGTPFVDEDRDLLATFAGQAAVAIENARLFQKTDQQLEMRVRELETLERLDAELNRTLDLNQVAEVTVRQAMSILRADAGIVGIVHRSPDYLQVAATKGYTEQDVPPGTQGSRWPLDVGIVKRVMRSRQADIAMDVSIDPDYSSGLPNSNSQITIPMMSGKEVNAILVLEKNTLPRFSLTDWAFAQRIAEHASIAIANAQFYAALNQANRSKSEFMGFAAHELKNPLASVKGYADVMISGMTGDLSDQQKNFVGIIRSNAQRMETIISDLRDAAKVDAGEFRVDPEPMNVYGSVVETLRPFVRFLDEKRQMLVNKVPEDLPLVMGDETRIIQVLTNLVSNAHKYSPADTTITVAAYLDERFVDQSGKQRGKMVVISVTDQGLGISEEDQNRLFKERYFRSTNREALEQPGTGLGMLLTYNIIQQHGGEIWLKSKLGEGSTFLFAIPVFDEEKMRREADKREKAARN